MLAKLTAKNQLTLPKAAVDAVGTTEYFDVAVQAGQIVLTPVRIQRGDAVRAKLTALGLSPDDVSDAVRWARASAPVEHVAAESAAGYRAAPGVARKPKPMAKTKTKRLASSPPKKSGSA